MDTYNLKNKPVQAEQLTIDNADALAKSVGGAVSHIDATNVTLQVPTLNGVVPINAGDWLVIDPNTNKVSIMKDAEFNDCYVIA